eukprot:Blabericola_migrator_1__2704@NODE_176_length_11972_cov_72_986308_g153_i0_p7_GENE_NODE_176_length_11972_cov_72_986308_g153_i0NODE_176_length_11972_cov_72_986308_g153_i0_p7_ORF_typecomplete_len114_score1_01DUF3565/PF12088_8/0_024DUF3565/PF12088_8/4e03_NODE_176_length_11972_cov_72_986308_g153_i051975538
MPCATQSAPKSERHSGQHVRHRPSLPLSSQHWIYPHRIRESRLMRLQTLMNSRGTVQKFTSSASVVNPLVNPIWVPWQLSITGLQPVMFHCRKSSVCMGAPRVSFNALGPQCL